MENLVKWTQVYKFMLKFFQSSFISKQINFVEHKNWRYVVWIQLFFLFAHHEIASVQSFLRKRAVFDSFVELAVTRIYFWVAESDDSPSDFAGQPFDTVDYHDR